MNKTEIVEKVHRNILFAPTIFIDFLLVPKPGFNILG